MAIILNRAWTLHAEPAVVWRYMRDTERLNTAAGLQIVQFVDTPVPEGGACRIGGFDFLGMRVEWQEMPFEWQAARWMGVERVYRKGPLRSLLTRFELEPAGPGCTTARLTLTAEPRGLLAVPIVRAQLMGPVGKGFGRALQHLDAFLQGRARVPWADDAPRLQPDAHAIQARARTALAAAGIEPAVADRVLNDALELPDRDVARVRPHDMAQALGVPRSRVLRALLVAAEAGLYDLIWHANCPHCRGGARSKHLRDLQVLNACLMCNVEFQASFDREVEVTFAPSREVRVPDLSDHCVGGPGKTPHVVAQRRIAPGATVELLVPNEQGTWRLRSPLGGPPALLTVAASAGQSSDVTATTAGWQIDSPVAPGGILRITNATQYEQVASLDDPRGEIGAVTGAQVSALQAFRSRFVNEVMAPGQDMAIRNMTFMFTDLRSSTAMYEHVGDGAALEFVRRHFDVLFRVVEQHDGAVVKTVGDAVMAVFDSPGDAVQAALQAVAEMAQVLNSEGESLVLRVGVHAGACLAVNLDGRLDYFGSTVNRAARIEHESSGNDVVFSSALLANPAVQAACAGLHADRYLAALRGVSEPVELVRVRVPEVAARRSPRRSWSGEQGPAQ